MSSQTDDLNVNEEVNEEDDDEDDPFAMAVKELSETNRQADEIARVSISLCLTIFSSQKNLFSNDQFIHNHRSHQHQLHLLNHNHFQI